MSNVSFYHRVYQVVKKIPLGKVATYKGVARLAGNAKASRAVGTAMKHNPDMKTIPCHRVVGSDGAMHGYSAGKGISTKIKLLKREGVIFKNSKVDFQVSGWRGNVYMLNLNSIIIGSMQPKVLADFYEGVFAKKPDMVEDEWFGWLVGSCFLSVGHHSKMQGKTKDPGRVMFNLETKEVKEEFERIKKLGATVVKEPYEMQGAWIATFADPDGNYFQLMTPWESK